MHRRSTISLLSTCALTVLLGLSASSASASTPHLSFPCGAPVDAVVTCRLAGTGFHPHERLHIAYHVAITVADGKQRKHVYPRTTVTDSHGSFTRPAFSFAVDPRVLIYRVTVDVDGVRGDHAEIGAFGTP